MKKEIINMKLSARNQFKGKIVDIQEGAVNGIVKIDIGGGNVVSQGASAVTERGVCWSTSQHPTINNSHANRRSSHAQRLPA